MIATFSPVKAFTSVDLPTFGRPATATSPVLTACRRLWPPSSASARRARGPRPPRPRPPAFRPPRRSGRVRVTSPAPGPPSILVARPPELSIHATSARSEPSDSAPPPLCRPGPCPSDLSASARPSRATDLLPTLEPNGEMRARVRRTAPKSGRSPQLGVPQPLTARTARATTRPGSSRRCARRSGRGPARRASRRATAGNRRTATP